MYRLGQLTPSDLLASVTGASPVGVSGSVDTSNLGAATVNFSLSPLILIGAGVLGLFFFGRAAKRTGQGAARKARAVGRALRA